MVFSEPYLKNQRKYVTVRCVCGSPPKQVAVSNLTTGHTTSCGCYRKEVTSARMTTHGATPGGRRPALYRTWKGMRERCNNPNAQNYKWYGGKGIGVCIEWAEFGAFQNWALAHGYAKGLEIDRIESEDHYRPGNCRWVTKKRNLRSRDRYWSDELDAQLVSYAAKANMNPYEVIEQAVREHLASQDGR